MRGRLRVYTYGFNDILHVAQNQYHDIEMAMRLGHHTCWNRTVEGQCRHWRHVSGDKVKPHFHCTTLVKLAYRVDQGRWANLLAIVNPRIIMIEDATRCLREHQT